MPTTLTPVSFAATDLDAIAQASGRVAIVVDPEGRMGQSARRVNRLTKGAVKRFVESDGFAKVKAGQVTTLAWPVGMDAQAVDILCLPRARIERVLAKKVLSSEAMVPTGDQAREALATCFLEGRLWPKTLAATRERLEAIGLQARLDQAEGKKAELPPELEVWVRARIEALGFESGEDLELLDSEDLLADDLPSWQRETLDRLYPRQLKFADAELIGIPHRLVVSERGLANGELEYRHRRDEESRNLKREEALKLLQ